VKNQDFGGVVAGGEGVVAGGEVGLVVASSPLIMANAAMTTTTAATAAPISRFLLLFILLTLLQLAAHTAQLKPATALEMATPSPERNATTHNGSRLPTRAAAGLVAAAHSARAFTSERGVE
jgi:hypothetical protein